jgi:hypothetical protein
MDAERSEPMIVDGMHQIIAQRHLTVLCESYKQFFAAGGPSVEVFLDAMLGHGFALYKITERDDILPISANV